jgi:hypothetical protein
MDRALWLLLWLRFRGWLRRLGRNLRTPRGVALTLLGLVVFAPMIAALFASPGRMSGGMVPGVRRFGPLGLFTLCVLGLLGSNSPENAIAFTPAEVGLLFPAPFRKRELLAYKVTRVMGLCLLITPIMTAFFAPYGRWVVAELVGVFLTFVFLQMFSLAMGLAAQVIGAMAYDRRRRLVLAGLAALALVASIEAGREAPVRAPWEVVTRVEHSTALRGVQAPFRPFIAAFTAERLWPDLAGPAALALGINVALIAFIFVLDVQYVEASAASSAKLYARLERARRGGGVLALRRPAPVKRGLPMPPTWGGIGPVAWRQLTTAQRDSARLLLALLVLAPALLPVIFDPAAQGDPARVAATLGWIVLGSGFILTSMVPFDFRSDIDRMAELKALPIPPWRIAVGQLATPALLVTLGQWAILAIVAARLGTLGGRYAALAALAPVANLLMVAVENLVFLAFPTRMATGNPADIQGMGRVIVLMLTKLAFGGLAAGLALGLGYATYLLSGGSRIAGLAAGWAALAACAAALVPPVAWAFRRFDVARDTPT